MSNELTTKDSNLEQALALAGAMPQDLRIPSLNIAKANSTSTKDGSSTAGDFFDGELTRSYGKALTVVVCDFRWVVRSFEANPYKFVKSLYLLKQDYNPKNEDLQKFKSDYPTIPKGKIKAHKIEESQDLLIYLPEQGLYRHFLCKGQLSKLATTMIQNSIVRTPNGIILKPVMYETVFKEYNGHEWYVLSQMPNQFEPIEPPNLTEYMTAFNKVFADIENDDGTAEEQR